MIGASVRGSTLACVLVSSFAVAAMTCTPARAEIPSCAGNFNGDSLVETSDYGLSVESTAGAKGDVVGVTVTLDSQLVNPGWNALGVTLCHDPAVLELEGGPVYTPEALSVALTVDFVPIGKESRPELDPEGNGFDFNLNFLKVGYDGRFPSPEPMVLMTVYYRIIGEPGQVSALSFCDGVLAVANGRCRYNYIHAYSADRPQGWDFFSTRNQDGAVTVLEGPATHPERPPEPPLAEVYDDLPADAAINFRARVTGGSGAPGGSGTPVEVYAAADVEYTGLLLAIDFDERYLRLDRVDRHIQPGSSMIDNRDLEAGAGTGEGHVFVTNVFGVNAYRMAAAGEEVHVATLHFDVLEAAAEIQQTSLSVVPITDHRGLLYEPFIVVRHHQGLGVAEPPVENQIEPFSVTNGLFRIVHGGGGFIRGDANYDLQVDLSDALYTLSFLFLGGGPPLCPDAADANDDGRLEISDPIATLEHLFLKPGPLPPPAGDAGEDPTADNLRCPGEEF